MTDPVEEIIGDYKAFAAQQRDRVAARGIDVTPYAVSHIAYRVPEWDEYIMVRGLLERHAVAKREGFWNGRPMSLILFEDFTNVKFHQRSLRETAEMTGSRFDGFQHLDTYEPQRLFTATGPNPLPR
jgi:predicted metalloenzyme YecM